MLHSFVSEVGGEHKGSQAEGPCSPVVYFQQWYEQAMEK